MQQIYELSISSHWVRKRCVLKGQDLIKLITFTVSSKTSLSKGGNFFLTMQRIVEEYSHWCHHPDLCQVGSCAFTLSVLISSV